MPIISTFFGIIIRMYFDDHDPPHFHAEYQGETAIVGLDGLVIVGELPRTARRLVKEWAQIRQRELLADWCKAKNLEPLEQIAPLE